MSTAVVEVFPSERLSTHWKSPVKKSKSTQNKSESPKGKIPNRYNNIIKGLSKLRGIETRVRSNGESDLEGKYLTYVRQLLYSNKFEKLSKEMEWLYIRDNIIISIPNWKMYYNNYWINILAETQWDTAQETKKEWLKTNTAPWPTVEDYFEGSQDLRKADIQKAKSLGTILSEWPILRHAKAAILIEKDFVHLNISNISMEFMVFDKFINELIKIRPPNSRDSEAADYIKTLNSDANEGMKIDVFIIFEGFYIVCDVIYIYLFRYESFCWYLSSTSLDMPLSEEI